MLTTICTTFADIFGVTERQYAALKIGKVAANALYDSGANISVVSQRVFRKIPLAQRPLKLPISTSSAGCANGSGLSFDGCYMMNIEIMGRVIEHPFFVSPNLKGEALLGVDFIKKHGLEHDTMRDCLYFREGSGRPPGNVAALRLTKQTRIPALTALKVKAQCVQEDNRVMTQECLGVADVFSPDFPLLYHPPALLEVDENGVTQFYVQNCSPEDIVLERQSMVGCLSVVNEQQFFDINREQAGLVVAAAQIEADSLSSVPCRGMKDSDEQVPLRRAPLISREKLLEQVTLHCPDAEKEKYEELLFQYRDVFSSNENDLGYSSLVQHEIHLKSPAPVYRKQFRIPDQHLEFLQRQTKEWLSLGLVYPSMSRFNSPLFAVPKKKPGEFRAVQDFRALNEASYPDQYSMKDVTECISEIGKAGSGIFSTLDLTSGFRQMCLSAKSQPYTAFTIPGMGQYQWKVAPMGLLGCPASFQRLIEKVCEGLQNVIVYIDDLLVHSDTHSQHRRQLQELFERLRQHNIRASPRKCVFGAQTVPYLGFQLSSQGVTPGKDKLKAVREAPAPQTVREVRQFLGLCNFFRNHVRDFSRVAQPLIQLTCKASDWKERTPLPEAAHHSFCQLKNILCSEPVLAFPKKGRKYCLFVDAATGDEHHPGGLGAVLMQQDEKGVFHVISYASRSLIAHEKNYSPFLLEMQAAAWGIDYFSTELTGKPFILFTDHKPLEKLSKIHKKTLNRLQLLMNEYDFIIQYKKGEEMPADYLSRSPLLKPIIESTEIYDDDNDVARVLKNFLLHKNLPDDPNIAKIVKMFAPLSFIDHDKVYIKLKRKKFPEIVVEIPPSNLIAQIIHDAHDSWIGGHAGIVKCRERILQSYWWPGMDGDIQTHISNCQTCQKFSKHDAPPPSVLTPLPATTHPNERIHVDLFGPLKASENAKKYVMCITDSFTKYVELVALPDKEAVTVASALFNRWICRFSIPEKICSDGGKEFCNKLSNELYSIMQITRLKTSPYHPQCNSQAETVNKTIQKYLRSFVTTDTLDWEQYLAPLAISYNSSLHSSTLITPFFATFGYDAILPGSHALPARRRLYGETYPTELYSRLQLARRIVSEHNEDTRRKYTAKFNADKNEHSYKIDDLVWLSCPPAVKAVNKKLSPKWSGPYKIVELVGVNNVKIVLANIGTTSSKNKVLLVHVNRLKPHRASDSPIYAEPDDSVSHPAPAGTNFDGEGTGEPVEFGPVEFDYFVPDEFQEEQQIEEDPPDPADPPPPEEEEPPAPDARQQEVANEVPANPLDRLALDVFGPRSTRSRGPVPDLPLPGRAPEYKPYPPRHHDPP